MMFLLLLNYCRAIAFRSYKGLVATMISGAPYTGIQMTTYELMQVSSLNSKEIR